MFVSISQKCQCLTAHECGLHQPAGMCFPFSLSSSASSSDCSSSLTSSKWGKGHVFIIIIRLEGHLETEKQHILPALCSDRPDADTDSPSSSSSSSSSSLWLLDWSSPSSSSSSSEPDPDAKQDKENLTVNQ